MHDQLAGIRLSIKCFLSHHPDVMVRAFKVYVRPMLKYAVCVWSPCYTTMQ